ncbi:hypothetical protein GQ53DRAFT_879280 [Thozetella sp. PMI_491]|nr:hypothetical protein GQ53DRAFT_879280 [Thozetella sp. PMI_491]
MRVSLPVDPGNKTREEVATLRFLLANTTIPVPKVTAFDDSASNELGFEWILLEPMPGVSAYQRWRKLKLADFQAQFFSYGFRGIGTLEESKGPKSDMKSFAPGPGAVVSMRGKNSGTAQKLLGLLPKIFPALQSPPARSFLWHADLSLSNILVDDQGSITALIDWECVSAVPFWAAAQMPKFLGKGGREQEPKCDEYTDEDFTTAKSGQGEDELDNEGKNSLYWVHLMEYDMTHMRKVYTARMRELQPGWDEEVAECLLRTDFWNATVQCNSGYFLRDVDEWVSAVEKGDFISFLDVQARKVVEDE